VLPSKSHLFDNSARWMKDSNGEYTVLQKLIKQIPDDEETGELLSPFPD
jgi:hypothetical protein